MSEQSDRANALTRIVAKQAMRPDDARLREAFMAGHVWCFEHSDMDGMPYDTPAEAYAAWLSQRPQEP